MKKRIILIFLSLITIQLAAQELTVGMQVGILTESIFDTPYSYNPLSVGIQGEFRPQHAYFSINTDLNYMFEIKTIITPFALKVLFGDKIRPNVRVGFVPIIRFTPDEINSIFGFGCIWGYGLDVRLSSKYIVFGKFDNCYLPYNQEYKYGSIIKSWDKEPFILLGLRYIIT